MNSKQWVIAAVGLAGALAAGAAMARGGDEVQWSVTIGSAAGVPVYTSPVPVVPVHAVPGDWRYDDGQPVGGRHGYRGPADHSGYRAYARPTRWDRDGDGIPNRRDRLYNPRWDRDGDGIPNRRDRRYNPPWDRDGDGIPNRHDRHDGSGYRWGR